MLRAIDVSLLPLVTLAVRTDLPDVSLRWSVRFAAPGAGITAIGVGELLCKAGLPGVTMGVVFSGGEDYLWQYTPYQLPGKVTRR